MMIAENQNPLIGISSWLSLGFADLIQFKNSVSLSSASLWRTLLYSIYPDGGYRVILALCNSQR